VSGDALSLDYEVDVAFAGDGSQSDKGSVSGDSESDIDSGEEVESVERMKKSSAEASSTVKASGPGAKQNFTTRNVKNAQGAKKKARGRVVKF
jgi:hypothetical protein